MRGRYLHILIVITRLAAGTLIVPATLVTGLLTFPTTCTCGAEQPHEHSIFGIADHHHGGQHVRNDGPHGEAIRVETQGVTLQTPTGTAAPALTAVHQDAVRLLSLPQASTPNETIQTPSGRSTTPDVPPPRA
jgi:hypothetical protein